MERLTLIQVAPEWKKGHVESNVSHSWVGLEDGNDGKLNKHKEHGMLPRKKPKTL